MSASRPAPLGDQVDPRVAVLRVAPTLSGPGRYAEQAAEASGSPEALVTLLVNPSRESEYSDSRIVPGVRTGSYTLDVGVNSWLPRFAFRRLRRQWRGGGEGVPQIVHYAAVDVPPLDLPLTEVVTIHDSPATYFGTGLYRARRRYRWTLGRRLRTYRRFRHVLTVSHHVRRALEADGFEGRIEVIPTCARPVFHPGIAPMEERRALGLPTDRRIVLSVSTDEPRKNLRAVRDVMDRLGPEFLLVRVGPGLPGAKVFENVDDRTLAALYRSADVFLFPSLEEGLGLPLIESFASGLPAVAARIESVEEVSRGAAYLAEATDVAALAEGVRSLVSDPDPWRAKVLARAQEYTLGRFHARMRAYYRGLPLPGSGVGRAEASP